MAATPELRNPGARVTAAVGIIGAGLMGTACSKRLRQAGFDVVGYDVDAAKLEMLARLGVRAAASVAAVTQACESLVLCVFSTEQVEQVVEGAGGIAEAGGPAGRTVICTSTCDPDRLAALAARVVPRGVRFLETPISGTSRQVADGDGVGLIGGARAVMDAAAPVLDAICRRRFYLGAVGNGSRAKLAVNLILGLNRAAMAEGLAFAARLGLDPVAFLEVARGSAAHSQVMDVKGPLMARRDYANPQSRVDQSLKDFRLMLAQARAAGQALPFATVYAQLLEDCVRQGEGEWDNAAILEAIRRRGS
jgi:3-hydroxyisobutyrate dehydrogenase-like beta-hydroxyacid dehydrogenase